MRKLWDKRVFQRRKSKESYAMLVRDLKFEIPDSFRSYLRMEIRDWVR